MSDAQPSSVTDETRHSLTLLTACVERFIDCWEKGDAPRLADFLPAEQGPVRRLTLAELIKVDLEYRWTQDRQPKSISQYVREFPELAEGGIPADVIYEEFHILKQCGINVDPGRYVELFPEQAAELRCLLGLAQPYESTAVFRGDTKRALDDVRVGMRFDDFDLLALLGKGAFASVYLARQHSMQRLVALKVSANTGTEHQTLAQLDHDHIVRVFDYRVAADRDLRLLYMQYLPGGTLQSVIKEARGVVLSKRSGRLLLDAVRKSLEDRGESRAAESHLAAQLQRMNWGELVCWIGARLAQALDYAHSRGILHRDVKPANVLLSAEGVPKLADFNISFCSKLAGASPAAYFGGSLAYMSPEQLDACNPSHWRQAESLDGRSDLYSLGIMLWELLTGRRPFADPPADVGWSKMLGAMSLERNETTSATLAEISPAFPAGLVDVLRKTLSPDPRDRWKSGAEMAHRLELCLKPRAHDLLFPPKHSWRTRLRRHAVAIIVSIVAVPNILAGVFNWFYNREQIVKELARSELPNALQAFDRIQLVVNFIAYPVGLVLGGFLAYPMVAALTRPPTMGPVDRQTLRKLRHRSLFMGRLAAIVGVTEWALAGIVYPLSLWAAAGPMPTIQSAYFFFSLLLCGFVAASYPFFGVTFYTVRCIYPALARLNLSAVDDADVIRLLMRRSRLYLVLTAAIPLLAMMAVLAVESHAQYALWAFCGTALVGIALASWLFWQLQGDLEALLEALPNSPESPFPDES